MRDKVNEFRKTRTGSLIFGGLGLVVAYVFVSLAIDTGSLLQYAVALIALYIAVQSLAYFIKLDIYHQHHAKKKPKRRSQKA